MQAYQVDIALPIFCAQRLQQAEKCGLFTGLQCQQGGVMFMQILRIQVTKAIGVFKKILQKSLAIKRITDVEI